MGNEKIKVGHNNSSRWNHWKIKMKGYGVVVSADIKTVQ